MRKPLWWIWLSTFVPLVLWGDEYLMQPRGELWKSGWVANVVRRTCAEIRAERKSKAGRSAVIPMRRRSEG